MNFGPKGAALFGVRVRFMRDRINSVLCALVVLSAFSLLAVLGAAAQNAPNEVLNEGDAALANEDVPDLYDPLLAPVPEYVPEPVPTGPLRIASWDLSAATDIMPALQTAAVQSTAWRTTFGSERRTEADSRAAATSHEAPVSAVDADVVLLQGISDTAALGRLFPRKSWRVIYARRADKPSASATALPAPMAAVAVRARRGLRITGREHIPAAARAGEAPADQELPSSIVVRIVDRGRNFWLLSVALPDACRTPGAECQARQRVADWQRSKQGAKEAAVVGGRLGRPAADGAAPAARCSDQTIEVIEGSGASRGEQGAERQGAGCVALLELPRS